MYMQERVFGFSQSAALKFKLELVDFIILRWFINFKESGNMVSKEMDGEPYYWVNYERLVETYPMLYIKKNAVYRHFKKMADLGILKRKTVKQGGTYSYYTTGENYSLLIDGNVINNSVEDNLENDIETDQIKSSQEIQNDYKVDESGQIYVPYVEIFDATPQSLNANQKSSNSKQKFSNSEQKINKTYNKNILEESEVEAPVERQLSNLLFSYVKKRDPGAKTPNFSRWDKTFWYILKQDGRYFSEVKDIITWVHEESDFWWCHILNPNSLRKHYEKLVAGKLYEEEKGKMEKQKKYSYLDEFEII